MKNKIFISTTLLVISSLCFGSTLHSMNKVQFEKTFTSIPTDNLNGRTIDNTFSMYLDTQGNILGKMTHKPANEPQTDKGIYTITDDGTFYITWQHWDGAKKICGRIFDTQNAYISIDCDNIFHTVFMKNSSHSGNHLR